MNRFESSACAAPPVKYSRAAANGIEQLNHPAM
jgi:hypothetical protein